MGLHLPRKAGAPRAAVRRGRRAALWTVLGAGALLMGGCSDLKRAWMPDPKDTQGEHTLHLWQGGWLANFGQQGWLHVKLSFVILLYCYFYSLHRIYKQQQNGIFKISPQKLRIWNEVATVFLIAIVMLAVVKNALSWLWGLLGLVALMILLLAAIKIYKKIRKS